MLLRKIGSFSDPRLYALALVAEHLAQSSQPLVPERVFMAGGQRRERPQRRRRTAGMLGMLINLLVAEKSGFALADQDAMASLQEFSRQDDARGDGVDAAGRA